MRFLRLVAGEEDASPPGFGGIELLWKGKTKLTIYTVYLTGTLQQMGLSAVLVFPGKLSRICSFCPELVGSLQQWPQPVREAGPWAGIIEWARQMLYLHIYYNLILYLRKTMVLERVLRQPSNHDLPVQYCDKKSQCNPWMLKQGNSMKDWEECSKYTCTENTVSLVYYFRRMLKSWKTETKSTWNLESLREHRISVLSNFQTLMTALKNFYRSLGTYLKILLNCVHSHYTAAMHLPFFLHPFLY